MKSVLYVHQLSYRLEAPYCKKRAKNLETYSDLKVRCGKQIMNSPYPLDPWPLSEKVQKTLQMIVDYTSDIWIEILYLVL